MDLVQRQADEVLARADFQGEDEPDDGLEDCTCDDIPDEEFTGGEFPLCDGCRQFEALLDQEVNE